MEKISLRKKCSKSIISGPCFVPPVAMAQYTLDFILELRNSPHSVMAVEKLPRVACVVHKKVPKERKNQIKQPKKPQVPTTVKPKVEKYNPFDALLDE